MTVAEVEVLVGGDDRGAQQAFARARTGMKELARDGTSILRDGARSWGDALVQGMGQALGNFSVQGAVQVVKELIGGMIGGNAEMERYTLQFETLLKTVDKAKDRMAALAKFADVTPFETPEVVEADRVLQVFGGSLLATGESLRMVGDVAAGAGRKYGEVAFWVGRAYAALQGGKPLGEPIQNLMQMGVLTGKTARQLEDLQKAGGSTSEAWKILTKDFGQFDGAMAKQAKSWDGMVSTLKDTVSRTIREIGAPAFEKAKTVVGGLLQVLGSPMGQQAVKALLGLAAAAAGFAASLVAFEIWERVGVTLAKVGLAFQKVGGAMGLVRSAIALLSGPVGWVIAAAGLMYVAWTNNWGGIREFTAQVVGYIVGFVQQNLPKMKETASQVLGWMQAAWKALLPTVTFVWSAIVNVLGAAWSIIKTVVMTGVRVVTGIVATAMDLLRGNWSGAWESIKGTMASVWGAMQSVVARAAAGVLGVVHSMLQGVSNAWASAKSAMGLGGGDAGQVTFLKGAIDGLNGYADAADRAATKVSALGNVKPAKIDWSKMFSFGGGGSAPSLMGGGEMQGLMDSLGAGTFGDDKKGKSKRGGKGRSSASDAMRDMMQEGASLKERLFEVTKAIALQGDATESLSTAYDIAHGKVALWNLGAATELMHFQAKKEGVDRLTASNKEWASSLDEARRAVLLSTATSEEDRIAIEKYGIAFKAITDPAIVKNIQALAKARKDLKTNEGRTSEVAWAKEQLSSLKDELAARGHLTRLQQLNIELAKSQHAALTDIERDNLRAAALALDQDDATKRQTAWLDGMRSMWAGITERVRQYKQAQQEAANERYSDAMQSLNERIRLTGSSADVARFKLERMAISFGHGATDAEKMATGMALANKVMEMTLQVERIEAFRERLQTVAKSVTETFMDMFDNLMKKGFDNFFDNVISGFRTMLAQMVKEWIESEIRRAIMGFVMNALGGAMTGSVNPQASQQYSSPIGPTQGGAPMGHAVGGPVLSHQAVIVGEHGPELFVPAGMGGSIMTNAQTRAAANAGGGITVVMNVTTPDVGSFKASDGQLARSIARKLGHATRRA